MSRIDELFEIIRLANVELEQIRTACVHPSYRVCWWSCRIGDMRPSKICDACQTSLGAPSQLEINTFMTGERANRAKFLRENYPLEQVDLLEKDCPFYDPWTKEL